MENEWVKFEKYGIALSFINNELWYAPLMVDGNIDFECSGVVENFEGEGFAEFCLNNFNLKGWQKNECMEQIFVNLKQKQKEMEKHKMEYETEDGEIKYLIELTKIVKVKVPNLQVNEMVGNWQITIGIQQQILFITPYWEGEPGIYFDLCENDNEKPILQWFDDSFKITGNLEKDAQTIERILNKIICDKK